MHVLGSCEASAQYSPINFFVNLSHSKNSNLPDCFSDLIQTEYRKLHKNNGHSPFVSPSIMRSSVGQCRNIRFRQLSASHVIITSEIASDCFRIVIIEKNNNVEQRNSTPKVDEIEYSTVLSLTVFNRKQTQHVRTPYSHCMV